MSADIPCLERGPLGKLADFLTFPLRALFMPERSRLGLSSLRDQRMRLVAAIAKGKGLDIGCGPGNVYSRHFRRDSLGIDCFAYAGVERVVEDLAQLPFADGEFDTVTLIAVGGHIPRDKRAQEFAEIARVLKPGGQLVLTEGEPVTQTMSHVYRHWISRLTGHKGMDDERGMEEEEEYCMPFRELMGYIDSPPFSLQRRIRCMWGLNNVYVSRRADR